MFNNFRRTMAVCVMALILLCGCTERGQTERTVYRVDEYEIPGSPGYSGSPDLPVTGPGGSEVRPDADSGAARQEKNQSRSDGGGSADGSAADHTLQNDPFIYVDVCGAVNAPGVVSVPEGSRVYQAVEKAGGLSPEADSRYINQARILIDGEQVYVPAKEETEGLSENASDRLSADPSFSGGYTGDNGGSVTDGADAFARSGNTDTPDGSRTPGVDAAGKVNINTADSETLQTLNGIGSSRAEAIILYRETDGPFETIEDIMRVAGIKNAVFAKIKDDITVG